MPRPEVQMATATATTNGEVFTFTAPKPPTTARLKGTILAGHGAMLGKLPSLKPPRDLTLGGRAIPSSTACKKVFTPNLNVVRNKNAKVKTSKDTTARGRGRGRGARGSRGGRGGQSSLIQTAGLFSEGAGAVNIRKSLYSGSSYSRSSDDTPSQMRKPTYIKNEDKKIDLKEEAAHIYNILGDSDEDDLMHEKTDLDNVPVKLNEVKWKDAIAEIKLEPADLDTPAAEETPLNADTDSENDIAMAQKLQSLHVQKEELLRQQASAAASAALSHYPTSVQQLLDTTQQRIFVIQMPDTLPCEDDSSDLPEKRETNEQAQTSSMAANSSSSSTTTSNATTGTDAKRRSHNLKNMEEGQVGKLLRYKSGKTKLLLGKTYFDLDMGMETGYLQHLMSISTNREERSGNMINLGPVQAKVTATPDWDYMMKWQM